MGMGDANTCEHRWLPWGMDAALRCSKCGLLKSELPAKPREPGELVALASGLLRNALVDERTPSTTRSRLRDLADEAEFIAGALALVGGNDA